MNEIANKMKDYAFILAVTGLYTFIANIVGFTPDVGKSAIGCLILVVLTLVGCFIALLPGFKRLPMVFWVSIVCVIISLPSMPGSAVLLSYTKEVNFLAITTPILAYAGLSIGKDIEAFKQLSWRIVPVALAVAAGSFVCSAALAEVILHLEGIF